MYYFINEFMELPRRFVVSCLLEGLNEHLMVNRFCFLQLIRDVLNVSEMTLRSPEPSCVGKYRALRCSIETLPPDSFAFQNIAALQQDRFFLRTEKNPTQIVQQRRFIKPLNVSLCRSPVQIHQIMRVSRGAELQSFKAELGNIRPLLHSSSPSNFVGILSR